MPNAYSPDIVRAAVALAGARLLSLQRQRKAQQEEAARLDDSPFNNRELRRRKAFDDPEWFSREILGVKLYDRQVDILLALRDAAVADKTAGEINQVSVSGANGVGKDFTIGRAIIPWWLEVFEPAKAIVTGPTGRQVFDIVWQETRASFLAAKYPLRGHMLPRAAQWQVSPETFAFGFSTDKPYNILGFHSPHLLVIVTEAHSFGEDHLTQLRRLLPQALLLSGNPLAEAGTFYLSHHDQRDAYRTVEISAWDSPNVKAGETVVPGLVTRGDIATLAEAWGIPFEDLEELKESGKASPAFDSTVNGNFSASPAGLIPLAWIMQARSVEQFDPNGPDVEAGLDVAGPGEDETSLWVRQGPKLIGHHSWPDPDPRGEVVAQLRTYGPKLRIVNVDSAGIGYYLALHLQDQGFNVRLVNVGESARESEKYANLKAELYWGLRMRFEAADVLGIDDNIAAAQLASIRYKLNPRGQVEIEKKEELKKRIGKSPDRAEGIMLCFAYGDGYTSTEELREKFEAKPPDGHITIRERERREDERQSENIVEKVF